EPEDPPESESEQLVHDFGPARVDVGRHRITAWDPRALAVDRAVVEPALELRDDRDESIAVRIALACEVAIERGDRRQRLAREVAADPLDGLREHRRLDVLRRSRQAGPAPGGGPDAGQ